MARVYLEWVDRNGKVQDKELIATFETLSWAKTFVKNSQNEIDDRFSRYIIEEDAE